VLEPFGRGRGRVEVEVALPSYVDGDRESGKGHPVMCVRKGPRAHGRQGEWSVCGEGDKA